MKLRDNEISDGGNRFRLVEGYLQSAPEYADGHDPEEDDWGDAEDGDDYGKAIKIALVELAKMRKENF